MDQQVWNPIFSPSGTTPGKSPSFYNELDPLQQHHQQHLQQPDNQHHLQQQQLQPHQQQHQIHQHQHQHQHQQQIHRHSNHSTPSGDAIQLNASTSQQGTPSHISGNTPGAYSDTDQMFLQQMDYYEQQQQLSQHASAGNTPGTHPFDQHQQQQQQQQHLQHLQHHHPQQQQQQRRHPHQLHQHHHSQDIHQHAHLDSNGPSNHNTPSSSGGGAPPLPPQTYDLGLENMNFIMPEVLNFDTDPNHVSSAFPPELPSNQTPSLLAVNKLKEEEQLQLQQHHESSASPILRGQNDKSYNPQHYYHRQSSSGKIFTNSGNASNNNNNAPTVRPDAVFTPLVSPVVTPLDRGNTGSSFSPQPPLQISFEPLTSPVLKTESLTMASGNTPIASDAASASATTTTTSAIDDRRRSSSSVYAPSKDENKQYKRRTPHGTPVLQGNKSYISPSFKGKSGNNNNNNHNSSNNNSQQFTFEKLPESKVKSDPTSNQEMLPPSGKPVEINGTPLMGFTMGKLAEGNEQLQQTSPTVSSSSKKSSTKPSRKSSISKQQAPKSTSSSENSSPKLSSSNKKSTEKPATKKASHKLAEQGRRNRMNMAVQELGRLIPQSYHDEVSIPSKATTVELASKYIESLLKEVDELKATVNASNENNGKCNNDDS